MCHSAEDEDGELTEFTERRLTVTFDSSCAIWFFLNFGRTKSGDVEEDSQPPVVIIGAVTVGYTHKKVTRGLLQKLLTQEECSSSDGDGLNETHTNDKVVTEKDASRDTRKRRRLFHQECFAQLQGGDVPILYEACLQETKKKRKSEPLTPECQACQANEDTASRIRE